MAREKIVGLDIGTTKVCAVIAEIEEGGRIEIVGVGMSPSHGLRKGVVVDIDLTTKSIEHALAAAKQMAGVDVTSVVVGIGGGHIRGVNSHGIIAISRGREVTQADIDRVIDAARGVSIPVDQDIIHVIPQQFIIDGQGGIKEPIGMSGVRLEVDVHIVTGALTSLQNILKCVNKVGYGVEEVVLQSLASAHAVLTDDERGLGVVLIDIGGGTTDMAIFLDGSFCHNEIFSIGGENITKDISIGLRTPINAAEKLKKTFGHAVLTAISPEETIEIPLVGEQKGHTIPKYALINIIESRMEEIFTVVNQSLRIKGYDSQIGGGIVLTGGTSLLPGIVSLAEQIFNMSVRIGTPHGIGGLVDAVNAPIYSTGVGLVLYGLKKRLEGQPKAFFGKNIFKKFTSKIREWMNLFS